MFSTEFLKKLHKTVSTVKILIESTPLTSEDEINQAANKSFQAGRKCPSTYYNRILSDLFKLQYSDTKNPKVSHMP